MELILEICRRQVRDNIFFGDAVAHCYSLYLAKVLNYFCKTYHLTVIVDDDVAVELYLLNFKNLDYVLGYKDKNIAQFKHNSDCSMLLRPFSGPITEEGISRSLEMFKEDRSSICFACSPLPHNCHPDWLLRHDCTEHVQNPLDAGKLKTIFSDCNIARSQDLGPLYYPHGSIQVFAGNPVASSSTRLRYFLVEIARESPFFYHLPTFYLADDMDYCTV